MRVSAFLGWLVLTALLGAAACAALKAQATGSDRTARAVERVDAILPQTQCRQCGYAGCRPYASAIVREGAPITLCAPGGETVVRALAELLGAEPAARYEGPPGAELVRIDEDLCIGCTKCIQACPVDAIIGAPQLMHSVLIEDCTGCRLCIPVCPVDCIVPARVAPSARAWRWPLPVRHGVV